MLTLKHRLAVDQRRRLLKAGGAAIATPNDLAGLVAWLDGDDTTGFGTAGYTVNDKAVNGNEANDGVQTIIANQPDPGGDTLSFNGTTDSLLIPTSGDDFNWTSAGAYVIKMQAAAATPGKTETLYVSWQNAVAERTHIFINTSGELVWRIAINTSSFADVTIDAADLALDTLQYIGLVFNGGGSGNSERAICRVNGSQVTPSFTGTVPSAMVVNTAGDHGLGRFGATEYTGDIEFIMSHSGLPDAAALAIMEAA